MLAVKPRTPTPPLAAGVKGVLVIVDGEVRKDTMPMEADPLQKLIQELDMLASFYSEGGLPPKTFFARYASSSLLVLFSRRSTVAIWMEPSAKIVDVELAGRKLVSTAHLAGTHRTESALITESALKPVRLLTETIFPPHSTLTQLMSWSEASHALESILTKVLTHAQAARLIERTLADKGISAQGHFDLIQFREVGSEILQKIPNRSIRQSLTKEFDALVAKIS